MSVTNLLRETVRELSFHGKDKHQVMWVGNYEGSLALTWDNFAAIASSIDYDNGFGHSEIARDLVVVGDGWWLSRQVYDGSEWWEFNTCPVRKEDSKAFNRVLGEVDLVILNDAIKEKGEWQQVLE